MARTRVLAIRQLLADDDPVVVTSIRNHLRSDPELLDAVWQDACQHDDPCPLICEILLSREGGSIIQRYAEARDLEAGMLVLGELHLPRFDHVGFCRAHLNAIEAQIPVGCDGLGIARLLCGELGFRGDQDEYHDPVNSFLTTVLQRRRGLPISLTCLWLLLCRRRGVDGHAVALPGHVLGKANGLFIDLFAGGRELSLSEIVQRCGALQRDQLQALLEPASDRILLARMARNLITSYHIRRDEQRMHLARQLSHRAMALVPMH